MAEERTVTFDAELGGCASSEPYALQVTDDSMEPEFAEGCIIVVDPAGVIQDGCYVVARLDEDNYIFRQLHRREDGLYLKALRDGYETLEIPSIQAVVGVVVQRAGTRRKYHKTYY